MQASAALLLLAGCDAHYTVYLRARVADAQGPLAGAWVVPLQSTGQAARTGQDGSVALEHGGFLRNTAHSEILVLASGHRAQLLVPGRDFALRPRGFFMVTEWDAALVATLSPLGLEPGLPLRCDATTCTALLPATDPLQCEAFSVVLGEAGVWRSGGAPVRGQPAGNGAQLQRVPLPEGVRFPAEALVISTCRPSADGLAQVSLSDRVALAPPPP